METIEKNNNEKIENEELGDGNTNIKKKTSTKFFLRNHLQECAVVGYSLAGIAMVVLLIKGQYDKKIIKELKNDKFILQRRNQDLIALHNVKDVFFKELMSDGLRHGSPVAAKHMADYRYCKANIN